MIKIASIEDLPIIKEMGMKFAAHAGYTEHVEEEVIGQLATQIINSDKSSSIILMYEDVGMLVAVATPFIFGTKKIATEIAWWVEPGSRGKQAGKELLEAFEFWANKVGCKITTMSSIDEGVGHYLETQNYKLYEYSYVKEL